jgi:hypothetical protein
MISKRTIVFVFLVSLIGLSAVGASPEQFVETVFGELPAVQKIRVTGDVKEGLAQAYGGRYPGFSVSCWQQDDQRVWVLKARGKHGFVHAGLVTRDGMLVQIQVLSSKEQRGRMIETPRFLDQFAGAGLQEGGTLDRQIDGISGATYSVNAIQKMARAALYLDLIMDSGSP